MKTFDSNQIMHSEKIDEYTKNKNTALQGGGQDRILSQHEKGKLTARERIDLTYLMKVLLLKSIQ